MFNLFPKKMLDLNDGWQITNHEFMGVSAKSMTLHRAFFGKGGNLKLCFIKHEDHSRCILLLSTYCFLIFKYIERHIWNFRLDRIRSRVQVNSDNKFIPHRINFHNNHSISHVFFAWSQKGHRRITESFKRDRYLCRQKKRLPKICILHGLWRPTSERQKIFPFITLFYCRLLSLVQMAKISIIRSHETSFPFFLWMAAESKSSRWS